MGDKETMHVDCHRNGSGLTRVQVDYPSNSHKKREEQKEERRVTKVVTGKVSRQKKPFGKKMMDTFIGDSIGNVGSYVLYDVLIPAAKSMLYDMVKGSFEMALFGEKQGSRTKRDGGKSYVSYNSISSSRDRVDRSRQSEPRNRNRHIIDDIVVATRGEAEEVLSTLVDLCIDYDEATVGDLYDLVGITRHYTDNKYGWTDLRSASVTRVRDGYLINLPKTILLD